MIPFSMYARVLDPCRLAGECVDVLRSETDAPLDACIHAAQAVVDRVAEFVSTDDMSRITAALSLFSLDVEGCHDGRLLTALATVISHICDEKSELSYSISQDDVELVEGLKRFADCTRKTDPRVPLHVIQEDDYALLGQIVDLYHMEQQLHVRLAAVDCVSAVAECCPQTRAFLLDSKLAPVLAQKIPSSPPLSTESSAAIRLLTTIYAAGQPPPLAHYDVLSCDVFTRLLRVMEDHPEECLPLVVHFNNVTSDDVSSPVLSALEAYPTPAFGQIFIEHFNKNCREPELKLLLDVCGAGEGLVNGLFYRNDLAVLSRVLTREMIDASEEKTRRLCVVCLGELARCGYADSDALLLLSEVDMEDACKQTAIDLIKTVQ